MSRARPIPKRPISPPSSRITRGAKAIAEGEIFDATPANIEKRVKRFTLSNGLKVAFFPKKSRRRSRRRPLDAPFRQRESLPGKTTAAGFIGSLMMRGTKNLSRLKFKKSSINSPPALRRQRRRLAECELGNQTRHSTPTC